MLFNLDCVLTAYLAVVAVAIFALIVNELERKILGVEEGGMKPLDVLSALAWPITLPYGMACTLYMAHVRKQNLKVIENFVKQLEVQAGENEKEDLGVGEEVKGTEEVLFDLDASAEEPEDKEGLGDEEAKRVPPGLYRTPPEDIEW